MNTHPLPDPGSPDALYILDLSSWSRAYYEMARHLARTNPKAPDPDAPDELGVVRGVARRLIDEVIVARQPAFLGIALDVIGEPPARAALWDGYKRGRTPPGPGYARQVGILLEVLRAHRIPCLQDSRYEADDFIAALTRRGRLAGLRVVILSGDNDLWTLFESKDPTAVVGWNVSKGEVHSAEDCLKKYGVPPEQLVDAMALAGDGDEAPGIKGIGHETAAKLLARHGTLDLVLERWQWAGGKLATRLRDGAEMARLSKQLVTLDTSAPILCPLQALALGWGEADAREIRRLGAEYRLGALGKVQPGAFPKAVIDRGLEERWLAAGAALEGAARSIDLPPLPSEDDAVEREERLAIQALDGNDDEVPAVEADDPGVGEPPPCIAEIATDPTTTPGVRGLAQALLDHDVVVASLAPAAAAPALGWRSLVTWPTEDEEDATPLNRWWLVEGRWAELIREGAQPEASLLYILRSEYDEAAATTEGRMHKPRSLVRVFWRGTTEDVEIPNRLVARYLQPGEPVPDSALPILPLKRPRIVGAPAAPPLASEAAPPASPEAPRPQLDLFSLPSAPAASRQPVPTQPGAHR